MVSGRWEPNLVPLEDQLEPNVLPSVFVLRRLLLCHNKIAFLGIVILTGRYTVLHCPGFKVYAELSDVILLLVCHCL